ncbi:MAG: hypothetical protein HWE10_07255 [Gammaproteobacteria bacterium]|nr:hypothetical protein [Gammaproteobacteria bacterium]
MKVFVSTIILALVADFIVRVGIPIESPKSVNFNKMEIKKLSKNTPSKINDHTISLWGQSKESIKDTETIFDQVTLDSIKSFGDYQVVLYAVSEQSGERHAVLWLKNQNVVPNEVISSKLVKLGDVVEGAKVTKLTTRQVILTYENSEITLEMFKRI